MQRGLMAYVLTAAIACAAFTVSTTANAFLLVFDEFGNGSLTGVSDPGVLAPDPSSSIGVPVLTYSLRGNLVGAGDVAVCEFVACSNSLSDPNLSDIIRFTNATGALTGATADRMIFYSDPGDLAPADTGFPPNAFTGTTGGPVIEQGVEGADFFIYTAGTNVYVGISDTAVPEPTSLALLGAGLLGLGMMYRRRKNV